MDSSTPASLIGRRVLVDRTLSSLGGTDAPGCVLVGAEGVGKSHLARHCADHLETTGRLVFRVLATRSAAAMPLGAFAPYVKRCDDHPQALQQARNDIVELAGSQRPLILVDDAHLLDVVSATLLLELVRAGDASTLSTYRIGEPCPDAVTALWKDLDVVRIDVGPFDDDEIAAFARATFGVDLPGPVLGELARLGGSRPLALRELLRPAELGGVMVDVDGVWSILDGASVPSGLSELLSKRLERMSVEEVTLLTTLALCEPLPVGVGEAIGGAQALESLERSGFIRTIRRSEDIHGGWIFQRKPAATVTELRLDHPLIGDVAIERAGDHSVRRLYAKAAASLGDGGDDPFDTMRATLWLLKAGEELSVDDLVAAARHQYQLGDYERCGELARAAWERGRRFDAGHLLGFALGRGGRGLEADELLAEVEGLADTEMQLAQVTLTRAEIRHQGLGDATGADELCRRVEGLIDDPHIRGEVTAYRAINVVQAGYFTRTLEMLEPFLDLAKAGDRTFVKASYPAGVALAHLGRSDDATELALLAMPIHEALWEREWFQTEPGVHHVTTLTALMSAGRFVEAETFLEVAREATREANPPYAFAWMSLLSGRVALRQGRFLDAVGHARMAIDIFSRDEFLGPAAWGHAILAAGCAMHGDLEAASSSLRRFEELPEAGYASSLATEARGWIRANDGDLAAARVEFAQGVDAAGERGDHMGALHLAIGLAQCGDPGAAIDRLHGLAADFQGDQARFCVSIAEALAGSVANGEIDSIVGDCTSRQSFHLAADVCAATATMLEARGDGRSAARWLDAARGHLRKTQGAVTPLTSGLSTARALTGRERDIALLAAQRTSSKQIAVRLGISVRTVDNHLGNVYRKLGISGRDDLADVLGRDETDAGGR